MTGRLIAVVGPSGVGKDTLMSALAETNSNFGIVRRVITRDPTLGGEDYDAVTENEFAERRAAGEFCLDWPAHGLFYGIPDNTRARIAKGEQLLINLSRNILLDAARVFPSLVVLNVTATPETLAKRLASRARETQDEIAQRLKRANLSLPEGLNVIQVSNDGALEDTIAQVMAKLYPAKV